MSEILNANQVLTNAQVDPQTQWYQDARLGLFIHWGMLTGNHDEDPFGPNMKYPYTTVEEFEVATGEWSAKRWVAEARKLGASYITIASFHCELGYLKIWPSDVPGSLATVRDCLGEIIAEAKSYDIRVIVYINRDTKNEWHAGVRWLDMDSYLQYREKNQPILANSVDRWLEQKNDRSLRAVYLQYSIDVMEEVCRNYADVAGFWFDGYHDREEAQVVFAHLHTIRPELVLINNNFGTSPVEDETAMALEDFGKHFSPSYDLPSGCWVDAGRHEFAFKTKWDWIYLGEGKQGWKSYQMNYEHLPSNVDLVKEVVSIIGNSWRAHLGYGPLIDGSFPSELASFTEHFESFIQWAAPSLYGSEGGGHGLGGFLPGYWNDGAHGVTTVRKDDPTTHFIHVLTAPTEQILTLDDAGYEVVAASDLRTGENLKFYNDKGRITIIVPTWEATEKYGDTIIVLKTSPSRNIVSASLSSNAAAISIDELVEWPCKLNLALDRSYVYGLLIHQPESGPSIPGGYAAPISERLHQIAVYLNKNEVADESLLENIESLPLLYSGELRNERGQQMLHFSEEVEATSLIIKFIDNYGGTNQLSIHSIDVLGNRIEY